jgi:probable addiction module antidote protein
LNTQKKLQVSPARIEMSAETAAENLNAALEAENLEAFMRQLGMVIKARGGYTATARATGLNRTALYKIASRDGNPALNTLTALLASMGLRLSVQPAVRAKSDDRVGTENQEGYTSAHEQQLRPD